MNKELGIKILTTGLLCAFLYSLLFIIYSPLVLAQDSTQGTEYKLLAPIPLGKKLDSVSNSANTSNYLQSLVRLAIAIAGAAAVLRIIWAGTQYMTSDAFGVKSDAKNTIQNALYGLLLAVSAYLILATVNPKLVNISLDIPGQTIAPTTIPSGSGSVLMPGGVRPGYVLMPSQISENTSIVQRLKQNNPSVGVNNNGNPCSTGGIAQCTNVVLLPEKAISGVIELAAGCKTRMGTDCNVIISGGSEGGHKTHGPGIGNVDVRDNLTLGNYIKRDGATASTDSCSRLGPQYSINGAIYVDEGDHWHVCY